MTNWWELYSERPEEYYFYIDGYGYLDTNGWISIVSSTLTTRQQLVLEYIRNNYTNTQIALELNVCVRAIQRIRKRIIKQLKNSWNK